MKNSKLKRRIWSASLSLFAIYLTILIVNPSTWVMLLPIIIPTGALTVGIPGYAVIKNSKDSLEKVAEKQKATIKKENTKHIETQKTNSNNKTIDNENNIIVDIQSEEELIQDKPKVKTKGTIR